MKQIFLPILIPGLVACGMGIEATASDELSRILVDPDSAKLSFVSKSGSSICGFVNAKNRMGGYIGDQVFIFSETEPPILLPIGGEALQKVTEQCVDTQLSRELLNRATTQNAANQRELEKLVDEIVE